MNRGSPVMLLWLLVLFLAAGGVTAAAYLSLVIPEYRGPTFFTALISSCAAELVFFGYLSFVLAVPQDARSASRPVRMRVITLVAWWSVAIIASGALAAAPSLADSFFSDKILLWQLIATFLLLFSVVLLHRQGVMAQDSHAEAQAQRDRLQSYAMGIDPLLAAVVRLGKRSPARLVELDRLGTRLNTLKMHLLACSPQAEREAQRPAGPASHDWIEQQLRGVHERTRSLDEAGESSLPQRIEEASAAVDSAIAALRQRENALTL